MFLLQLKSGYLKCLHSDCIADFHVHFFGHMWWLNSSVLTFNKELANLCMDTVAQKGSLQNLKFLEIGSGSGAISIILLKTFKKV